MAGRLATTSHSRDMLKLPSSIYEAYFLSQKKILHKGMEMVQKSLLAHRSCNQAIIFLYGLSGAGKTSSLNHLFGFELIQIVNKLRADTKVVTEYVATMESKEWGVSNLQIGFIDVPGWGDADSTESDIQNMAMIETFISKHPHLGSNSNLYKCYPNIIIIAIDATDKRLYGENVQVVRMFRALTKLNIIDKERPNVLIILTNIESIGKRTFNERLNEIRTAVKDLAICYLHTEPVIVYIENDYIDLELEKDDEDWTVLKDGTRQPKNVFDDMIAMMSRHNDEVGHEAVRIYFASRGTNKPVKKQCESSQPTENQIKKWSMIISQEFSTLRLSEVNQTLQKYIHSNPISYSCNSLVLLMVELENHSLTQLNNLQSMSLNRLQTILLPYKMSKLEKQALVEACGVKPLEHSDILLHVGYGLKTETGEITNNSVFDLEKCWHVKNGMRLPILMDVNFSKDKRRIEWKRLNEDFSLTEEINDLVAFTKQPKVIPKYQFQIFLNIYTISITLQEQELASHLNPMFKDKVSNLPATSIEGNHVREEYTDLLNIYGEWIVPACVFGGIIQGEMEIDEAKFKDSQKHLSTYIDNLLDRLESSDDIQPKPDNINQESTIFDKLEKTAILDWKGGKPCKSNLTLNSITPKLWNEWKISLNEFPIPLAKISNQPIHTYVSLLNTDTATQVELSYPTAYRNQLLGFQGAIQQSLTIHNTVTAGAAKSRETSALGCISSTLSKANGGFPNSVTVIRGTGEEFVSKHINEIQLGDTVLCRNPWKLKYREVSKINCTEEGEDLEYLFFKHEHGELLIGSEHTILQVSLFPVHRFRMVLAKEIREGDYLVFVDVKNKRELTSKVTTVDTKRGRGHYSLSIEDGFSDIAVNQVLTGDEEAACFPGNATVLLKGGKRVRMDELEVGNSVLSIHPTTSKPIYSKVYIWGHRDPHTTTTYLHIAHPQGYLHISADHLILGGYEKTLIPAHELRVGDVIYFMSLSTSQHMVSDVDRNVEDSYSLISVPVLHIHAYIHMGYYAPFTLNGLIVVDNIATSVYSQLPTHSQSNNNSWVRDNVTNQLILQFGMHRVSQCLLAPVRMVCKLGIGSVANEMNRKSNMHKYCHWLLNNF